MWGKKAAGVEKYILDKIVVFISLGILFFIVYEIEAKIIDKIVAVVNEDIIILSELREISSNYLKKMKTEYSLNYDEEQIRGIERRILEQLIDEKLIIQEAKRLGITITEKEVDLTIREVREDSKLSEDQFKQALVEEGVTLEKYRNEIRNQLIRMKILEQEIKHKVQIKEEEIEQYYREHLDSYNTPLEVRLQQILLMIPSEASEQEISQIREKAEEILKRIREGEDFYTLARLYSQDVSAAAGGDMGFFKQNELLPALNEVAFSLEVGEVSSIIHTSLGFHIIKILEKRERKKMTKEEREKEIEGILYNKKVEDKFKQWLKELRGKSYIQINL